MSIRATSPMDTAKPRSRKLYVLWAIALTLLLALGLFSWLVVVPMGGLSAALSRGLMPTYAVLSDGTFEKALHPDPAALRREVDTLGGPSTAAHRLRTYLCLPGALTGNMRRVAAIVMLEQCGDAGAPVLVERLSDDSEDLAIRVFASRALGRMAGTRPMNALKGALEDKQPEIRQAAREALEKIKKAQQEKQAKAKQPVETPAKPE